MYVLVFMGTSGGPVSAFRDFLFVSFTLWSFSLVQAHPLSFLNLDYPRIVNDDFHHAVAQRFDVLDNEFQPFQITRGTDRCFFLILKHIITIYVVVVWRKKNLFSL